jgi:hypothetical protein
MRQTVGMQSLHFHQSRLVSATLVGTLGLTLAACSSSSSSTPPSSPSATSASSSSAPTGSGSEPNSGAGATSAIEANWAKFFDAKTPTDERLTLLQNGQTFAAVIKAQAGSTLAAAATSKVTHVTLSGTSQAYVTYEILVGGKSALSGQQGVAVYQNGIWKVGDKSFCGLLKLENGGKSSGLPAGCQG